MIAAQQRFLHGQRLPVADFSVAKPSLRLTHARQVTQIDGDLVVAGLVDALEDRQRAQVPLLCFVVTAQAIHDRGKRCDVGRH